MEGKSHLRRYAIHPSGVWARVENGELLYAPLIVVVDEARAHIYLSGQMARDQRGLIASSDMRNQISTVCANIGKCLEYVGANFDDVVSTVTHVLDLKEYYAASDERFKYFKHTRPASTLVQVSALGSPEAKIEITAEAIIEVSRLVVAEEAI